MIDIYLVRHGEAAASWGQSPDPGLSELGRVQAHNTAHALRPLLADTEPALISSPLARALETAAPLAATLGLTVQVNDTFREIQAPVPLADRQTWLRQFMQERWDEQPESLHTWRDGPRRELLALHTTVVIFTHFLVINAVVGQIRGEEATLCCWPDNGSITHLRSGDNGLELVALGEQMKTMVN
jgi:broad specificity phosphatase PhoE